MGIVVVVRTYLHKYLASVNKLVVYWFDSEDTIILIE